MVAANALRYSKSDKRVFLGIAVLSFIVIGFLFWLIYFRSEPTSAPEWTRLLPALNAFLNSTSAVLVVGGVFAIINGKRRLHITCMLMAVAVSAVFLVSYVIYHHFQGNTLFLGQGIVRPFYFFVLVSHIIGSIAVVPLLLTVLYFAVTDSFVRHRQLARITYPIWLYVSITGVAVFVVLKYWS